MKRCSTAELDLRTLLTFSKNSWRNEIPLLLTMLEMSLLRENYCPLFSIHISSIEVQMFSYLVCYNYRNRN